MFQCPQCATELPADAALCPCCGKTFLSSRSQSATIRKVAANLKAKHGKKEPNAELEHPLEWKTIAGAAFVFLFLFAIAGYTMKTGFGGSSASNPWVDRDGRGRVSKAAKDSDLLAQISLTETQLLPSNDSVEARGELTNGSDRTILEAELKTFFRSPKGTVGPARGRVRMVEPGKTVNFVTSGSYRFDLDSLRLLSWHTELGDVSWAPTK